MLVRFGDAVKVLADGKIGGYLVRFSDENDTDLEGDYFTSETDFGPHKTSVVLYHHGLDSVLKGRKLGEGTLEKMDAGIWLEGQLAIRDAYDKAIFGMIKSSKLGWSSGTASHLVEFETKASGARWIKSWPLGLDASLTPTPAEPKNAVIPLKSIVAGSLFDQIKFSPEKNTQTLAVTIDTGPLVDILNEIQGVIEKKPQQSEEQEGGTDTIKKDKNVMENVPKVTLADNVTTTAPAAMDQAKYTEADLEAVAAKLAEKYAELFRTVTTTKNVEAPNLNLTTKRNDTSYKSAFYNYMLSGDTVPIKALEVGTDSEGGYLAPRDFLARIIEKRDERAISARVGVQVIDTMLKSVDVPVESSNSSFSFIAEEATISESAPAFGNVSIDLHKASYMVKVSWELMQDQAANLEGFLSNGAGRGWAKHENQYILSGTGTNQPQGALVGGTAGLTLDSATTIAAAEVPELLYKMGQDYRDNAVWTAEKETIGLLRGLSGNPFYFAPASDGSFTEKLWNLPIIESAYMGSVAASGKSLMVADWDLYGLVRRGGLAVRRLDELYAATGQIGFIYWIRWGGAVLQAEAFQYATQAA